MKELIVTGNGKLADAILGDFHLYSGIPARPFQPENPGDADAVFVHVGSGRQFAESLQCAVESGAAYIQASTGKDYVMNPPRESKCRYITAPNLDINIISLFAWFRSAGGLFDSGRISVTESHQADKKSLPGTALKICDYLRVPPSSITSIRDPETQRGLDISNLAQHAYHRIQIGDDDSRIVIETRIEGAKSYVKGLARIAACVHRLEPGNYEIDDLLRLGLLDA